MLAWIEENGVAVTNVSNFNDMAFTSSIVVPVEGRIMLRLGAGRISAGR